MRGENQYHGGKRYTRDSHIIFTLINLVDIGVNQNTMENEYQYHHHTLNYPGVIVYNYTISCRQMRLTENAKCNTGTSGRNRSAVTSNLL